VPQRRRTAEIIGLDQRDEVFQPFGFHAELSVLKRLR
jgi:hypothetical protein